jgi:excisionase family DNA binding protein
METKQSESSSQLHHLSTFLERTGLSRSSAYREIQRGTLKVVRIGRAVRISENEIRRFIAEVENQE